MRAYGIQEEINKLIFVSTAENSAICEIRDSYWSQKNFKIVVWELVFDLMSKFDNIKSIHLCLVQSCNLPRESIFLLF